MASGSRIGWRCCALTMQHVENPKLFLFRDLQSSCSLLSPCLTPLPHAGECSLCQDGAQIRLAPASGRVARAPRRGEECVPFFGAGRKRLRAHGDPWRRSPSCCERGAPPRRRISSGPPFLQPACPSFQTRMARESAGSTHDPERPCLAECVPSRFRYTPASPSPQLSFGKPCRYRAARLATCPLQPPPSNPQRPSAQTSPPKPRCRRASVSESCRSPAIRPCCKRRRTAPPPMWPAERIWPAEPPRVE